MCIKIKRNKREFNNNGYTLMHQAYSNFVLKQGNMYFK